MIRKEPARWRIVLQKRSRCFADADLRFAGNDALFEKRSIGSIRCSRECDRVD